MKTIKVKASGVGLHFVLEDSTGHRPERIFSVTNNKLVIIPMDYAKSFYNSEAITGWIKQGKLIIVQGKEELEKSAIEDQYLSEPIETINQAELLNIIKGNNMTKIKELFTGENKELALQLASLHSQELTQGVIGYIEDNIGLSLAND